MARRFCAICGKKLDENAPHFSMCINCFAKENPLFEIPKEFSFRMCNECGNCATFCPYNGKPYKDKLTLFSTSGDFKDSTNCGFMVKGTLNNPSIILRLNNNQRKLKFSKDGELIPADSQYTTNNDIKEFKKIKIIIKIILKNYSYLINREM